MSRLNQAPIAEKLVDDQVKVKPVWAVYFDSIVQGDVGTSFTPNITGLTAVGTPTISGVYYQNQGFTDFYIKIVPGTSTTSVLGTTFCKLPFNVTADAGGVAIEGTSAVPCAINAAAAVVYFPTWTAQTSPITISGRVNS